MYSGSLMKLRKLEGLEPLLERSSNRDMLFRLYGRFFSLTPLFDD